MSSKPRTIDNIGVDASSRYARDQSQLNAKLIEESRFIPQKAESSVLKPYTSSEFELYLQPNKQTSWAAFEPPSNYFSYGSPIFTYQLIPSLGSYEKQDADIDKLEALTGDDGEVKIVLDLLQKLGQLERTLDMINARRNQYQRG